MRLVQIILDATDDLVSFAQAVNNWPALCISGLLSLSLLIATWIVLPWLVLTATALAALAAFVWSVYAVCTSAPMIRPRILKIYSIALILATGAGLSFVWPGVVAEFSSLPLIAGILAALASFVAHERAGEVTLAVYRPDGRA